MPSVLPRIKRSYPAPASRFSSQQATYDATEDRGRRRPPRRTTSSEDYVANERRRQILTGTARDVHRNWVLLSWAVRKHLDYVADFTFQAATTDAGFNKEYEAVHTELSKRERFDVAGRHSLRRGLRIAEACKTIDGDVGWLKLAPAQGNPIRGTIQAIEGDRIGMPRGGLPANAKQEDWVNGVRVNPDNGRALAYGICRRVGGTRVELQRIVPARNLNLLANFETRYDLVRGISPIAAALNFFQDTYEGFDYAFAKLKLGQLFGVAITTAATTSAVPGQTPENTGDDEDDDTQSTSTTTEPRMVLGKGPFITELEEGEKTEVIESATPSTETVEFLKLVILIVLRSLDIPYSFLDESWTNFYGSRGGLIQYLHACNNKVLDLLEFLDEHHRWRMQLAVEDGELILPSGKDLDFLRWEYVPGGVPWWDQTKEVRGAAMGVAIGQTSPLRICRETGTNFFRNIDETALAMEYARSRGVPLTFADSTAFAPEIKVEAPAQ